MSFLFGDVYVTFIGGVLGVRKSSGQEKFHFPVSSGVLEFFWFC